MLGDGDVLERDAVVAALKQHGALFRARPRGRERRNGEVQKRTG